MFMNQRTALIITLLLLGVVAFLFRYMILTEVNARECGAVMLNEFGSQISSDFESLTGSKYSGDFDNSAKVELIENTYSFSWAMNTKLGEIEHIVQVGRFGLCPVLFGDINVVIPPSSSDIFEGYIESMGSPIKIEV